MLKYGIDINLKDGNSQTALHISITYDLCDINGSIINNEDYEFCIDNDGNNEYHKWVNSGCLICLYALMKKNLNYNLKNLKGNNALHEAVIKNNHESLRLLLENCQFDLEEKGEFDYNLIQLACVYSDLVINLFSFINTYI
jgi:ankyrin repeat protein